MNSMFLLFRLIKRKIAISLILGVIGAFVYSSPSHAIPPKEYYDNYFQALTLRLNQLRVAQLRRLQSAAHEVSNTNADSIGLPIGAEGIESAGPVSLEQIKEYFNYIRVSRSSDIPLQEQIQTQINTFHDLAKKHSRGELSSEGLEEAIFRLMRGPRREFLRRLVLDESAFISYDDAETSQGAPSPIHLLVQDVQHRTGESKALTYPNNLFSIPSQLTSNPWGYYFNNFYEFLAVRLHQHDSARMLIDSPRGATKEIVVNFFKTLAKNRHMGIYAFRVSFLNVVEGVKNRHILTRDLSFTSLESDERYSEILSILTQREAEYQIHLYEKTGAFEELWKVANMQAAGLSRHQVPTITPEKLSAVFNRRGQSSRNMQSSIVTYSVLNHRFSESDEERSVERDMLEEYSVDLNDKTTNQTEQQVEGQVTFQDKVRVRTIENQNVGKKVTKDAIFDVDSIYEATDPSRYQEILSKSYNLLGGVPEKVQELGELD